MRPTRPIRRAAPPRVRARIVFAVAVTIATPTSAQHASRRSTETRWYGAEPHVPMALVRNARDAGVVIESVSWVGSVPPSASRAIEQSRRAACAQWARVGSAWQAVDRWGQVVGSRRLAAREFYDVTECYEATFPDDPRQDVRPWTPGPIVLYAQGTWQPAPSVEWTPNGPERASHARFVETLTRLTLAPEAVRASSESPSDAPSLPPIAARTMFFRVHEEADAAARRPAVERHFAVTGGRVLVLAELAADGTWFAVHLDVSLGAQTSSNNRAYTPFAVFDMNGDGWPEVMVHESEGGGEFFGDTVISRDSNGAWRLVARSVGGSTA